MTERKKLKINCPHPLNIKNLPERVKEAWFYEGNEKSIHIVLRPVIRVLEIGNGFKIYHEQIEEQIDINF